MTAQETFDYVKGMKKTAMGDSDPRAKRCIEACNSMLKMIDERRVLMNRCFVLSNGLLCGHCNIECNALGKEKT